MKGLYKQGPHPEKRNNHFDQSPGESNINLLQRLPRPEQMWAVAKPL